MDGVIVVFIAAAAFCVGIILGAFGALFYQRTEPKSETPPAPEPEPKLEAHYPTVEGFNDLMARKKNKQHPLARG